MKKLLTLIIFLSVNTFADAYPDCNVIVENQHEIYPQQMVGIKATISGSPCHEATINIELSNSKEVLYSYKAKFKPHIAIDWRNLTEQDAINYAKRATDKNTILDCHELEPVDNDVFDVVLLVSNEQYKAYKASSCKAFYHQIHYEAGKTIVVPKGINNAIPVNKFGV